MLDQAAHTMHLIDPGSMAILNGATNAAGHIVSKTLQKLPESFTNAVAVSYASLMSDCRTKNQRFAVETMLGVVLVEVGGAGIKAVMMNRGVGVQGVTSKIVDIQPQFKGGGRNPTISEMHLHNAAVHDISSPARYSGKMFKFNTRDQARQFGDNAGVRKAARKFFGSATRGTVGRTNIPTFAHFKARKVPNGDTVMEFFAKSKEPLYIKRYIQIVDRNGAVKLRRQETIIKETGRLVNLKFNNFKE
ncbi:MAG: hypothetical protein COA94_03370 [Rickettsiales bacterium]|nr:MAG: hypothetical protein COA94_03370 [Rickettsiales bacterium]